MSYIENLSTEQLAAYLHSLADLENSLPIGANQMIKEAAKRLEKQAQMEDDGK
jgi:hypothetical protein